MTTKRNNKHWIQLRNLKKAQVLLILPCNAAACIGNYFRAEVYTKKGWNTWREADACLHDLREKGKVAFAAVDSCTLETEPAGQRGAIVFETEMDRVKNSTGKDWGAPSWRWFRPSSAGNWKYLEDLTEALVKGVRRVESMGFSQVFTLVNPRGYFLALAAAVKRCGLMDKWVLFRIPAHPRHLLPAVRQVAPFVRAAVKDRGFYGGMYPIPDLYPILKKETKLYKDSLPKTWKEHDQLTNFNLVKKGWVSLKGGKRE